METKICKTCEETKPVDDYYFTGGYRYNECKACVKAKKRRETEEAKIPEKGIIVKWRGVNYDGPYMVAETKEENTIIRGRKAVLVHDDPQNSRVDVVITKVIKSRTPFRAVVEALPVEGARRRPPIKWVVPEDAVSEEGKREALHYDT